MFYRTICKEGNEIFLEKRALTRKGLTLSFNTGFLLLWIFSVAISVSPHVCFISDLILISMFQR